MRVLVIHNRYRLAGGEDAAVRLEASMLCQAGAAVDLLEVSNDHIVSPLQRAVAALSLVYSERSKELVRARIARFQPDVVHVHNFFPVLTPAIYDADSYIPFIQTLHNYRLLCANAQLFRENSPCEECLGKSIPWPAVYHGCYRGSRPGSATVALMLSVHKFRKTWNSRVSRFIALTEFARALFVQHLGVEQANIVVKPNAAVDSGLGDGKGGYALFVGRLSSEKGIATLIEAAKCGLGMPLKVAGVGPSSESVNDAAASGTLDYLGSRTSLEITRLMRGARALLLPSLWYEGLPMVIPEAFSAGLPVVASNIGALSSLVANKKNGLLVHPGNAEALSQAVRMIAIAPDLEKSLREGARSTYEEKYRPEANVQSLFEIYEGALSQSRG
jgi:glycosyltransferase involved in cell wall biosynthesis